MLLLVCVNVCIQVYAYFKKNYYAVIVSLLKHVSGPTVLCVIHLK